ARAASSASGETAWRRALALHLLDGQTSQLVGSRRLLEENYQAWGPETALRRLKSLRAGGETGSPLRSQELASFDRALAASPGNAQAWHDLGVSCEDCGRRPDAARALGFACLLARDRAELWWDLAQVLHWEALLSIEDRAGKTERALQALEAACE